MIEESSCTITQTLIIHYKVGFACGASLALQGINSLENTTFNLENDIKLFKHCSSSGVYKIISIW